ncbi:hypothetical protein [Streptomyces jumonjinensis]|uniref:hypothetical protein n=1 Tax=Streptomyces jumonjinensis TaxID=1945 RepID=UPI0037BB5580
MSETVITSYRTVGGSTADVIETKRPNYSNYAWTCRGCTGGDTLIVSADNARKAADAHASGCRARPRG